MIEDKATEKWKERAKKLGLIVNAGVDKPEQKTGTSPKPTDEAEKSTARKRVRKKDPTRLLKTLS